MITALRRRIPTALILALPLVVYFVLYLLPLASIGRLSVDNGPLGQRFPHVAAAVAAGEAPDDAAADALRADLAELTPAERAEAARMLNQELGGFRSLLIETGKSLHEIPPGLEGLIASDPRWAEPRYWDVLARNAAPWTARHFQRALGISSDRIGRIGADGTDIYLRIMGRTLLIGAQVSVLALLIGYPLAYAIANGGRFLRAAVLTAVLVSFWTSILVRTTAWVVLLQTNGLTNKLLLSLGLIAEPLQLIFNRFGTVIAMTHVLLPFAILPIMNVMRQIPPAQADASRSLGAGPVETFLRVYFPQTLRGVGVGGGTVFILALGFYVTPALVGGPGDQMLAYYIADFVQKQLNWGMAATLSVMLMICVLLMLALLGLMRRIANRGEEA
ncbi:ABC transporter permease [Paracoccus denitrificans]|uniref:ABC transporter permease n=1 Tax=Paracoccus denitrificans TaxID=266 RepID=UPI000CEC1AD0|nr:ABC transporter permease [Paracoccus denitrificans]